MIKKVIFFIIFIMGILILFKNPIFKPYTSNIYYDLDENDSVNKINIDVENLTLKLIYTNNNYINVSRDTINKRYNTMEYTSSYVDNVLNVNKFVKGTNQSNARDILTIEIPMDSQIDAINISAENCEVDIDGLASDTLTIEGSGYLNLNISNNTIGDAFIKSNTINSNINNTLIKNNIVYNVDSGNINETNVTGFNEKISNVYELNYRNDNSIYETTTFTSSLVNIDYTLNNSVSYEFSNLADSKFNSSLNEKDGKYYYNSKTEGLPKYVIECNDNKFSNLTIFKKQAIEEI